MLEHILFTHAQIHSYMNTGHIHTATQPNKLTSKYPQNLTSENIHSKHTTNPKSKHKYCLATPNKNPTFETQISKHTDQKERALNKRN